MTRPRSRSILKVLTGVILVAVLLVVFCNPDRLSILDPIIRGPENIYGKLVANTAPLNVIYRSPIRGGIIDKYDKNNLVSGQWQIITCRQISASTPPDGQTKVVPITPDVSKYHKLMSRIIADHVKVVVESSAIDAWHTTPQGLEDLIRLRQHALRVVIFDGGHHIPTLALQPDLIIVPVTCGYVAHGYMRDAVPLDKLTALARRENLSCSIVAVPRWALVKTPDSMSRIAVRALTRLSLGKNGTALEGQVLKPHFTCLNRSAYYYINHIPDRKDLRIKNLSDHDIKKLYIAFNFSIVDQKQAGSVVDSYRKAGFEVVPLNAALNVAGAMARGGL